MRFAISTTLLPRENIFWIEEWIKYHLYIGFDALFLYDNTGSERYDIKCDSRWVVSLSGFNYKQHNIARMTGHLTDDDVHEIFHAIVDKYRGQVFVLPWQPRDENGQQFYGQTLAYRHFLETQGSRFDWVLLSDLDEFLWNHDFKDIVSEFAAAGCNEVRLRPKLFADRVVDGMPVIPTLSIASRIVNHADMNPKQFVRCADAIEPNVHFGGKWKSFYRPAIETPLEFHHYRIGMWWKGGESIIDSSLCSVVTHLHLNQNIYIPLPAYCEESGDFGGRQ